MKAVELGIELDGEVLGRVLDQLKRLEHEGYHFEWPTAPWSCSCGGRLGGCRTSSTSNPSG